MKLFGKRSEMVVTVPELSCSHCEMKVNKALSSLEGIKTVKADAASKRVTISYTGTAPSLETIASALTETGYSVSQ